MKCHVNSSRGFTLIELVVVIIIMSIMASITLHFLGTSAGVYATLLDQRRADGELLDAVERMRRESRIARTVLEGESNRWSFGNARDEFVSFGLSGNRFELNQYPLASGVEHLQFRYFDDANQELAVPLSASDRAAVQRVQVSLSVAKNVASSGTIINLHLLEGFLK